MLKRLPGLDEESCALIWTMVERRWESGGVGGIQTLDQEGYDVPTSLQVGSGCGFGNDLGLKAL